MNHIHSTDEDHAIFRRMSVAAHGRLLKADRQDALVMRARSLARDRGATPAEIQRNVIALDTDNPADCIGKTVSIVNEWRLASPGQRAYERDLAKQPTYHDGMQRPSWNQLGEVAQYSWERNPTDR